MTFKLRSEADAGHGKSRDKRSMFQIEQHYKGLGGGEEKLVESEEQSEGQTSWCLSEWGGGAQDEDQDEQGQWGTGKGTVPVEVLSKGAARSEFPFSRLTVAAENAKRAGVEARSCPCGCDPGKSPLLSESVASHMCVVRIKYGNERICTLESWGKKCINAGDSRFH